MNALQRYLALRSPRLGPFGATVLFWLLLALWLLNVADLSLTTYGIWLGFASESNGVMRYFLHQGTFTAAAFKVGLITIGVLLLWRFRRYRSALIAAVLLAAVFAAVVSYQAFWLASL